ncbi:MAG: hypothetical protein RIQ54_212 [Candidatus Parcubacteria bacterium]|jgi:hypothetical protein
MMKKIIFIASLVSLLFVNSQTGVLASEITGSITTGISTGVSGTVISEVSASPESGTYSSTQSVVLSAAGASSIHYTTDDSQPSCTSEQIYTTPITVASSLTIKAIACYPNNVTSQGASFPYVIQTTPQGGGGGGGGGNTVNNGPITQLGGGTGTTAPASTPVANTAPQGQVLGATTKCGITFNGYMGLGKKNDSEQVKKLQEFLNKELGISLPVTGFFGQLTVAAVKKFQLKYASEILAPWVPHGLPNDKTATGYVYKTTQRWINKLLCAEVDIPLPKLP